MWGYLLLNDSTLPKRHSIDTLCQAPIIDVVSALFHLDIQAKESEDQAKAIQSSEREVKTTNFKG